ncbi:MAG: hypothetical protein R3A11_04570 [Bdellovibrionota bacterium]
MLKKIANSLLVLTLVVGFVACNEKTTTVKKNQDDKTPPEETLVFSTLAIQRANEANAVEGACLPLKAVALDQKGAPIVVEKKVKFALPKADHVTYSLKADCSEPKETLSDLAIAATKSEQAFYMRVDQESKVEIIASYKFAGKEMKSSLEIEVLAKEGQALGSFKLSEDVSVKVGECKQVTIQALCDQGNPFTVTEQDLSVEVGPAAGLAYGATKEACEATTAAANQKIDLTIKVNENSASVFVKGVEEGDQAISIGVVGDVVTDDIKINVTAAEATGTNSGSTTVQPEAPSGS